MPAASSRVLVLVIALALVLALTPMRDWSYTRRLAASMSRSLPTVLERLKCWREKGCSKRAAMRLPVDRAAPRRMRWHAVALGGATAVPIA